MSRYHEVSLSNDALARRKQLDVRRMYFRRAIESYDEQRLLHAQLLEFADLASLSSRPMEPLDCR